MKNILITGAGGFLGKQVLKVFKSVGSEIYTIGRNPVGDSFKHIIADISTAKIELPDDIFFEKVIHLAGKAHVFPKNKKEVQAFYDTNHIGTINLLNSLDKLLKKPLMFINAGTVAVYGLEKGENINETELPKPNTPYAISKLQAEKEIEKWCKERQIVYLNLRLPLIVGNDAPGNLRAMVKAISKGRYFSIAGNNAKKSAVLAQDIAEFVFELNPKNVVSGTYNLTDGLHPSFNEIELAISKRLDKKIRVHLPIKFVKILAKFGNLLNKIKIPFPMNESNFKKIINTLTFSDSKAKQYLDWKPKSVIEFLENNLKA